MKRLVFSLLLFLTNPCFAAVDNRVAVCDMAISKLGITFYTSSELQTIARCSEPQIYKTPNNNTAIVSAVKTCILNNSGNKALQALSLYSNANKCLDPESLDDVVSKLLPPVTKLANPLIKKLRTTLRNCKKNNKLAAAAKQEKCIQKTYGVLKAGLTLGFIDNICKKVVNQNVNKKEWGCGTKYIPNMITFSKYSCSKIVKK